MNSEEIANFEARLGRRLPDDYRAFLTSHRESLLAVPLVFDPPKSGVIDQLFTIEDILKCERENVVGIPEQSLLYIGANLLGGGLYLKMSDVGFGQIHYMEQYCYRALFTSFADFLLNTHADENA